MVEGGDRFRRHHARRRRQLHRQHVAGILCEEGERFILRATVREHSEFNGQKQTKVNRAAKKEMAD